METDCIFPSPSFLSQHPHLSTPSGTMLLEGRLSGGERDKWQRMQRLKRTRAWWITVWSQSHESEHNTANTSVKQEDVFEFYLGHFHMCFEIGYVGVRSRKYSGRRKLPQVQHESLPSQSSVTLVRHQFTSNFIENVKFYYSWAVVFWLCYSTLRVCGYLAEGHYKFLLVWHKWFLTPHNTFRGVNIIRGEQTFNRSCLVEADLYPLS